MYPRLKNYRIEKNTLFNGKKAQFAGLFCAIVFLLGGSHFVIAQGVPSNQLGQQLWFAGHESGNQNEWTSDGGGGEFNSGTGNSFVSNEQAKSGTRSLKLTINTTSGNSHGTRNYRWKEIGNYEDLIYTFYVYFPHRIDFDPNNAWFNMIQTKGVKYAAGGPGTGPDQRNDPHYVVGLGVRGGAGKKGENYLTLADLQRFWGGATNIVWEAPAGVNLPTQKWIKIQLRIIQKKDDTGRILIWQDDQLIIDSGLRNTLRPEVDANHFSINAYADKTFPNQTAYYIDDVSINLPGDQNKPPNKLTYKAELEEGGKVRVATQKNETIIQITEPTINSVFGENSNITIKANVSNSDSGISRVEFYQGTTLIGTKTNAPFELNWTPPSKGNFNIRVKGVFENGDFKFSENLILLVK